MQVAFSSLLRSAPKSLKIARSTGTWGQREPCQRRYLALMKATDLRDRHDDAIAPSEARRGIGVSLSNDR